MKNDSKNIRIIESGDMFEVVHSENEEYKSFCRALINFEKETRKQLNKSKDSNNIHVNDIVIEFRGGMFSILVDTGDYSEFHSKL